MIKTVQTETRDGEEFEVTRSIHWLVFIPTAFLLYCAMIQGDVGCWLLLIGMWVPYGAFLIGANTWALIAITAVIWYGVSIGEKNINDMQYAAVHAHHHKAIVNND